jgi:hypothetical protein
MEMRKKQKRLIPVYRTPTGKIVKEPLIVSIDESGEYWLSPDQIDYLDAMRRSYEFAQETRATALSPYSKTAGSATPRITWVVVDASTSNTLNSTSPRVGGALGAPV